MRKSKMKNQGGFYGCIYELSSERQITGRRRFKAVLHEIHPSRDVWQTNGISWDEQYTQDNLDSVKDMSICVEFLTEERRLPFGHGLTEIRDNMPLLEGATVVGHCDRGYITEIEIDGVTKRVLMAEGYIDEMRYPKFVAWLQESLANGTVNGSVEIVGHSENENRIIYDGGWKKEGRVPQVYDYSGYAILGINPADDTAIVMELNNKTENNKEETVMDEQTKKEISKMFADSVAEMNSRWDEYWAKLAAKDAEIAQLKVAIEEKETEIARVEAEKEQLRADFEAQEAGITETNAKLTEANAKIEELEKSAKLAELNSALADFSEEERALAKDEIEAFQADPTSIEINSITSKICVEMVRRNKEAQAVIAEQNASAPDIFGAMKTPEENGEVNIY